MNSPRLVKRDKISPSAARKLICMMARHSNYYGAPKFQSDKDVQRYIEQTGQSFERLVESARVPSTPIPFENLIGSTWQSVGARVSQVDPKTGEETLLIDGDGEYSSASYWSHFEASRNAFDRAFEGNPYSNFQVACTMGMASIEAYVVHRLEYYNSQNPQNNLHESRENRVSFDSKIKQWVPIMTGGRRLDLSGESWQAFLRLREIRDDVTIHPKSPRFGVTLSEMAEKFNLYSPGIAGLLIDLHLLFDEKIPSTIIRAYYSPRIEVSAPMTLS